MFEENGEISEEIEEVRELLYNLLTDYPAGVTSTFLEEQYEKRYVESGMAAPLPKDWLRYIKLADEFEVKQISTFTMIYIVHHNGSSAVEEIMQMDEGNIEIDPIVKNVFVEAIKCPDVSESRSGKDVNGIPCSPGNLEPMSLNSLPEIGIAVKVNVISATDPENIYIRLCLWDPVPDYLYSALARLAFEEKQDEDEILPGKFFAARIENNLWQRVKIIRKSVTNAANNYWIVFAVDIGFFQVVHMDDLKPLSNEVQAFKKIFLVKCKIHGIRRINESVPLQQHPTTSSPVHWPKQAQQAVCELLCPAGTIAAGNYGNVDFIARTQWSYDNGTFSTQSLPFASGQFIVDGRDIGEKLVEMGLACSE